jgi:chloramphenicol 3-O-phosphotransferase
MIFAVDDRCRRRERRRLHDCLQVFAPLHGILVGVHCLSEELQRQDGAR